MVFFKWLVVLSRDRYFRYPNNWSFLNYGSLHSPVYGMPVVKQKCCAFPCKAFFCVNFGVKKDPGDRDLRCRICQASCTFVITKLRFVLKRWLADCCRIGAILSLFRPAKEGSDIPIYQSIIVRWNEELKFISCDWPRRNSPRLKKKRRENLSLTTYVQHWQNIQTPMPDTG